MKKVSDVCLYNNQRMAVVMTLRFEKQMLLIQFAKTKDGNFALVLGKSKELSPELNHSVDGQNLSRIVSKKRFFEVGQIFDR